MRGAFVHILHDYLTCLRRWRVTSACSSSANKHRFTALLGHPHIAYGIELYANTAVTHLNKLLILNNKLLRILQNKPYNYPSIPDLHIQQILLCFGFGFSGSPPPFLVHKFVHHKYRLPITFVDYFDFNTNIHGHNTRGSNDLHVISVNKNFSKRSIKHKACCGINYPMN